MNRTYYELYLLYHILKTFSIISLFIRLYAKTKICFLHGKMKRPADRQSYLCLLQVMFSVVPVYFISPFQFFVVIQPYKVIKTAKFHHIGSRRFGRAILLQVAE